MEERAMQRLGLLLAAVFVGVCLGGEPEPTYEGKTLGQWSAQAKDQDPRLREQAARALGRIGADVKAAIPMQELRKKLKALQSRGLFEEEESQTYLQEAETLIQGDADSKKSQSPNRTSATNPPDQ
jgi:hypothetical protein